MYVALVMMERSDYQPRDIVKIDPDKITPEILAYCLNQVVDVFRQLSSNRLIDVLAKNREATTTLIRWFEKTFKQEDILAIAGELPGNS